MLSRIRAGRMRGAGGPVGAAANLARPGARRRFAVPYVLGPRVVQAGPTVRRGGFARRDPRPCRGHPGGRLPPHRALGGAWRDDALRERLERAAAAHGRCSTCPRAARRVDALKRCAPGRRQVRIAVTKPPAHGRGSTTWSAWHRPRPLEDHDALGGSAREASAFPANVNIAPSSLAASASTDAAHGRGDPPALTPFSTSRETGRGPAFRACPAGQSEDGRCSRATARSPRSAIRMTARRP